MTNTTITALHWDMIVERIHKGLCVPFLGAGANVRSEGYEGLPLGSEVAIHLVEKMIGIPITDLNDVAQVIPHICLAQSERYKDLVRVALQDLARVALHVEFGADSAYLTNLLKTILPDDKREPSQLLTRLAQLPLQLIVTTNYDRLMERALEKNNQPYVLVIQPIKGFDVAALKELEAKLAEHEGVIVYKIHGTFREHELEDASAQIIITEEDYIEFLTVVGIQNVGVPNLIAEKIVDSTLLFLGYGLEDWDFRTIFKGLIERLPPRTQRKSFAIQKDPPDFWVEFWKKKNVEIYNMERPPARTGPAVRDKLERITSRRGHAIRALRLAASQ